MTRNISKILIAILAVMTLGGCSGYNKLLKSGDNELMYTKALEFYNTKKYQKTLQIFEMINHFYLGTAREDTIAYYTAAANYKLGDFETSGILLDDYRRKFGRSPFIEDAEYMYAKGFYFSSPAPERDQTTTHRALIAIDEYLNRYPKSVKKEILEANIVELTNKLHDKAFINAKSYYKTGRYKSAVVALKNAVRQYPESRHREELMYLTTKSAYLLASNSVEGMKRDRYMDMMDVYYNFASEYPESKYSKETDKMLEEAKKVLAKFSAKEEKEVMKNAPAEEATSDGTKTEEIKKEENNKDNTNSENGNQKK